MINLLVDECYAFDYLAILEVKKNKNAKNLHNWQQCKNHLELQLITLFDTIINSEEYKKLYEANEKTFDAVEKARYDLISAKEVDDCNGKRFIAKKELQEKFFPDSRITERKT
jgi:hypothetical protein